MAKSNEAISRKWPKTPILETKSEIIWRRIFFSKIGLHHFLRLIIGLLDAKNLRNPMIGFREKLVTNGRTNGLTDGLTD